MMDSELERNKRGTAESVIDSLIASGAVDAYTKGDLIMRKRQKLIGYFSVCSLYTGFITCISEFLKVLP